MMRHVVVYREAGRYAGWPANYGIWSWGNEIVVGFTLGSMKVGEEFHARDRSKPFVTMQSRAMDGGETWTTAPFPGARLAIADSQGTSIWKKAWALGTSSTAKTLLSTRPEISISCIPILR